MCARGKDLVHNVQWVCTVHCAPFMKWSWNTPLPDTLLRFKRAKKKWTGIWTCDWAMNGLYKRHLLCLHCSKCRFFLLTKARPSINVWGKFFSSLGKSSGNARKKLLWPHSRDLVMRAQKICRLYCDNAIQKQVKCRQSTLLRIDIKCNEIFHYA